MLMQKKKLCILQWEMTIDNVILGKELYLLDGYIVSSFRAQNKWE